MDTFTGRRYAGGPEPDLARLDGVRFVFVPEAERGGEVMDLLKMVSGNDPLPTWNHHAKTREMVPRFTLVLSANERPEFPADDSGARRRLREVPFRHRFPDDESIREQLTDPDIAGPAWLALLVEGHRR